MLKIKRFISKYSTPFIKQ